MNRLHRWFPFLSWPRPDKALLATAYFYCDAVLMGYGLCNNGINGVVARDV